MTPPVTPPVTPPATAGQREADGAEASRAESAAPAETGGSPPCPAAAGVAAATAAAAAPAVPDAEAVRHAEQLLAQAESDAAAIVARAEASAAQAEVARREVDTEIKTVKEEVRLLRADLERREVRLAEREQRMDEEARKADQRAESLEEVQRDLDRQRADLQQLDAERREILERVAGLTADQAKSELVTGIENQAKREAALIVREIEADARKEGDKRARKIVTLAIQRVASDQTSESVVSVLHLPGDEMKGRIIGREGRNIRAFESVTGVNLIIDDTPEAVLLSCFDPVRREVGRLTLERLVLDGRIHPQRIEEAYERSKSEIEQLCVRAGEDALVDVGITEMHPELTNLLGRLRYRTSYGQNVLKHLVESAHIAGMMASELGLDPVLMKRCTVLHDIGKALTHEVQGSHALIGAEIARRYGESRGRGARHRGAPQRGRGADRRGGADPGRGRDQRRTARRAPGVAGGLRDAAGAAGADRAGPRRGREGLRHAGRARGPDHGQADRRGRHPGAGHRQGRGQAGRGGADLPGPDPRDGRARVPRDRVRPLTRLTRAPRPGRPDLLVLPLGNGDHGTPGGVKPRICP